jgi:hypothetical protein
MIWIQFEARAGRFFSSIMSSQGLISVQTLVKWVARALSQAETVSSPPTSIDIKGVYITVLGHAVAQLVEALRYKPEGRRFDSRWCHWIFSLT